MWSQRVRITLKENPYYKFGKGLRDNEPLEVMR